ncbi:regulator of nitric oxide reductase transcription [Actibacterium atlanticum]|uniref:Regulator of nitric oxide reductase transcription n=1 Tax=Actibacterium atlanticum TaxID=1461693 RepID=A0A058ZLQ6_9RHOB|nr:4Fe-4S binding protein [Actibacterium atlanticum]KCV82132.1 regulator of nitric oxide reductase transcription [Actibacterium atlanticum]
MALRILAWLLAQSLLLVVAAQAALAKEPLSPDQIATYLPVGYSVGELLSDDGVYSLISYTGSQAGYVFETGPIAPLSGFAGAPIEMLVMVDNDARFIDVQLIDHFEPMFVAGLGNARFQAFLDQYAGQAITEPFVVGNPFGSAKDQQASALTYLDGVTTATASVRIANETLLTAVKKVAKERMQGLSAGPPAQPDPLVQESLSWDDLVRQGIAARTIITNAEVEEAFAGTIFAGQDPEALANPQAPYLDLWIVDIGPPSVARAALSQDTLAELESFHDIYPNDEPILLIETARHGLVTEDFIRNTVPSLISAKQGGFPFALRDSDLLLELADDAPQDGIAMVLRTDRRSGFNPIEPWEISLQAKREKGVVQPKIGTISLTTTYAAPARFFVTPKPPRVVPPWVSAIEQRWVDMVVLAAVLFGVFLLLLRRMEWLAGLAIYTPVRLVFLACMIGFVGWYGQGQLSIVTPLGALRSVAAGQNLGFLLYDPFSILIWGVVIFGFVVWGRGLFCGWLCPFGAMQEFMHHLGRWLRLPRIEPSPIWDTRLKWLKYGVLAGLVMVTLLVPSAMDKAAEVEPFKTAISTYFKREWYYVAYSAFWLIAATMLFKGFCRYVCPLGALMAIGGLLRRREWIARRSECGSPCQLCKVKCNYGAITKTGRIRYDECFECLDCVTIYNDKTQCVPLILKSKKERLS